MQIVNSSQVQKYLAWVQIAVQVKFASQVKFVSKLYFDFIKVIFRLSAEAKVFFHNLPAGQISLQRNITVEDNITA